MLTIKLFGCCFDACKKKQIYDIHKINEWIKQNSNPRLIRWKRNEKSCVSL